MRIINGENLILGRTASRVAKAALFGEEIVLLNCAKLMISGNRKSIFAKQLQKAQRGPRPNKGPFYQSLPDMFVRRTIGRMLPTTSRGRETLKRIKCYISVPEQFKDKPQETFEKDNIQKMPYLKYITVAEVCKLMGVQITETQSVSGAPKIIE